MHPVEYTELELLWIQEQSAVLSAEEQAQVDQMQSHRPDLDAEHRACSVPQEMSDAAIDIELDQIQAAAGTPDSATQQQQAALTGMQQAPLGGMQQAPLGGMQQQQQHFVPCPLVLHM